MNMPFHGAKLALFVGDDLAVILRDNRPDIPWPDCWDMPGGGREGGETPLACALRETHEELGLIVPTEQVVWGKRFYSELGDKWFFAAHLEASAATRIKLGNEGQRWALMSAETYMAHPKTISHLADRLRCYLRAEQGNWSGT